MRGMGLSNRGEALSMKSDGTKRLQGSAMPGGAVALVALEGVVREAAAKLPHQAVAGDLGADGGGSDGQTGGVGADDRRLTVGEAAGGIQRKGVHNHVVGVEPEAPERAVHGQAPGGGDAGFIDFTRGGVRHADGGGAGVNQASQAFAGAGRQLLGVGNTGEQPGVGVGNGRQDDGRRGQRACPSTASGFVHPRDQAMPLPQQPAFPVRRWEPEREGGDWSGLPRRLGAPLLDARRAANPVAQVVKLGAPDLAVANDPNVVDDR